jgi:hypothetical protein
MSAIAAPCPVLSTAEPAVKNPPPPCITARPSVLEKMRFRALALRSGMSESALALVAIRSLLGEDAKTFETRATSMERLAATDRITIRLRPGDGAVIARRAAARGMKASGYLSALVRAHVRGNPPLPHVELAALKSSVTVLAGLGQVFARLARSSALTDTDGEALRRDIAQARVALAGLEQQTHSLAKAALIAWESRSE